MRLQIRLSVADRADFPSLAGSWPYLAAAGPIPDWGQRHKGIFREPGSPERGRSFRAIEDRPTPGYFPVIDWLWKRVC